jgi:formylglycine-generating enzyme required for sulfatase activity
LSPRQFGVSTSGYKHYQSVIKIQCLAGALFQRQLSNRGDISHESLIRQWQTLRAWVDEEAAAAKIYRRLAETAVLYEEGKAELYWDADLKQCLHWKRHFRPNRSWALRYAGDFNRAMEFLRESRLMRCTSKKEKARAKAEREQLLKERAHLAEQRAEQERASRKRARRWTATVTVFALLLLMGFGLLLVLYKEGVPLRYVFSVAQEWVLYRLGASHLKEPKMLRVPPEGLPQEFQMGAEDGTDDERPVHPVRIARPYAIGQFEVTFEEYDSFAKKAGFSAPSDWGWGRRRQPVVNVSWEDARRYAQWLSWVTGKAYRLPTESEWEYAARAGTRTAYWWGGATRQNGEVWANCAKCGSNWDGIRPAPVGSFPPNPFGLYDTADNTWEWVQDCWHENYLGAPDDGAAWLRADDGECRHRVVRSGSWFVKPSAVRSANRYRFDSDYRVHNVGFRLAQDL